MAGVWCAPGGTRTRDLSLRRRALYPLSYKSKNITALVTVLLVAEPSIT